MTGPEKGVAGSLVAILLLMAACGGGENARQDELNALREKVRVAQKDEDRLFDRLRVAVSLRTRLRSLASDPLRQDPINLEERLKDSGTQLGLKVLRFRPTTEEQSSGPLSLEIYSARIKGTNDALARWLKDVASWEVSLVPIGIDSSTDPLSSLYVHDVTFALPVWSMPPEAARPKEAAAPAQSDASGVDYEIWRLKQNLARFEAARKALTGVEQEIGQLTAIQDALDGLKNRSQVLLASLFDILDAAGRAGALSGFRLDGDGAQVEAVVLSRQGQEALVSGLAASPHLAEVKVASQEQTRAGIRVVVHAKIHGEPGAVGS